MYRSVSNCNFAWLIMLCGEVWLPYSNKLIIDEAFLVHTTRVHAHAAYSVHNCQPVKPSWTVRDVCGVVVAAVVVRNLFFLHTAPGCPPLEILRNGEKRMELNGAVVRYSCDASYELIGSQIMYCDGMRWNDSRPVCNCKYRKYQLISVSDGLHGFAALADLFDSESWCWKQKHSSSTASSTRITSKPKFHLQQQGRYQRGARISRRVESTKHFAKKISAKLKWYASHFEATVSVPVKFRKCYIGPASQTWRRSQRCHSISRCV